MACKGVHFVIYVTKVFHIYLSHCEILQIHLNKTFLLCGIHLPEILCKCREEMLYARKSLSDFCVKCIIDSFHAAVLWKCSALSPRAFVRWVLG